MSTTTTNYKLIKPALTDAADITAMNENWDKLDQVVNANLAEAKSYAGTLVNQHNNNSNSHSDIRTAVNEAKTSATKALTDAKSYTDSKVAAIPTPDVSGQINAHDASSSAHADIRSEIQHTNLLHNWYMLDPVNSRGQTEYVGNGYSIDRWRGGYTSDVFTVISGSGLKFENKRTTEGYSYFRQYLGYYLEEGTYTLSVLVKEVGSAAVYIANDNGDAVPKTMQLHVGMNTMTVEVPADRGNRVQFVVAYNSSITVSAIKLERGSMQTLAHQNASGDWILNDVPNKAEETFKCIHSTADSEDTYTNKSVMGFTYGTDDLTAGTSPLATGQLYFVYE
jgi:hypothetical protein